MNSNGKIDDSSSSGNDSPNPEEIAKKRKLRALNNSSALSAAPTHLTSIQSKITNVVNHRIKKMIQDSVLNEDGMGHRRSEGNEGSAEAAVGEYWDITTNHGNDNSQYIQIKPTYVGPRRN